MDSQILRRSRSNIGLRNLSLQIQHLSFLPQLWISSAVHMISAETFFGLRVWKQQNVPSLVYLKMVQKITGYLVKELRASWLLKLVSVQSKEEHKPSKYTLDIVFSSDRHINELLMKVFGLRESGNCSSWPPKFNEWLLCLESSILGCNLQLFVFETFVKGVLFLIINKMWTERFRFVLRVWKLAAPGASKTRALSEPDLVTILNCSIINYNLVIIKMLL